MASRKPKPAPRRRKGEGSVRPVAGRENYFRADRTVDGHTYSATGATEEEALAALQGKIDAAARSKAGGRDPGAVTIESYTRAWLDRRELDVEEGALSRSTHQWEKGLLSSHIWPAFGDVPLPELTAEALESHYTALRRAPTRLSLTTVRRVNRTLAQAMRRVVRDYRIPNVALEVDFPRQTRKRPQRRLDVDALHRFWRVAESHRLYPLFRLASIFPTRSGELRGFKWADFDEHRRELALQRSITKTRDAGRSFDAREGGKTESNARILELDDALVTLLVAHRERQAEERHRAGRDWLDHDLLFTTTTGAPLTKENLLRQFKRLLGKAGLSEAHRIHDLRHTSSHHLLQSGATLPELAGAGGWSSIAVPAEVYSGTVQRVSRRLVTQVGNYYGPTPPEIAALDAPRADGQDRALSPAQLVEVQRLKGVGWTQARIAERFGVAPSTISRAVRGISGRHPSNRKARDLVADGAG